VARSSRSCFDGSVEMQQRPTTADELLEQARREIDRLTPAEAHERQLAGAIVVDIRSDTARERDGVVPGSVHVPRTVLEWRLDASGSWANPHLVGNELPFILLCDHGWSSSLAAATLRRLGHEGAGDVIGGFEEWRASGLPVVPVSGDCSDPDETPGMGPPFGRPAPRRPRVDQRSHWEAALETRPDRYGAAASEPARASFDLFRQRGDRDLVELGSGQGRDAIFFADAGLVVTAVDFTRAAVRAVAEKAEAAGVAERVAGVECDVRKQLPFEPATFDACYSHMLFCMALDEAELKALTAEIWRVLRPGGVCVYTARTTEDSDYGRGTPLGDDMYELAGFVVHFFDRDLVMRLASGTGEASFELLEVEEFEEGTLPRRLIRVTMRRR
jgi:SAM-dependent methyltransferase/rhodanese-related sulfurtransferase